MGDQNHRPMGHCLHGHRLRFRWMLKCPSRWNCDGGCGKDREVLKDSMRWSCEKCDFDLCQDCAEKTIVDVPTLSFWQVALFERFIRRLKANLNAGRRRGKL